jgi:hypothetical protein
VIVATVWLATPAVVAVKEAVVWPAAIVTLDGTVTIELLLTKEIGKPPAGAGLPIVIVPVDGLPPIKAVGFKLMEESPGGVMVRFATCDTPGNAVSCATV